MIASLLFMIAAIQAPETSPGDLLVKFKCENPRGVTFFQSKERNGWFNDGLGGTVTLTFDGAAPIAIELAHEGEETFDFGRSGATITKLPIQAPNELSALIIYPKDGEFDTAVILENDGEYRLYWTLYKRTVTMVGSFSALCSKL